MRPEEIIKLANGQLGSKFILIGEDDIDDEEFLRDSFKSVDDSFSLIFINNGRQVIDWIEENKDHHVPCLILLDYNMPELTGAEVLRALQHHEKLAKVPKVIWSTSASDHFKQTCIEAGADDYIIKP